jgi:hypothetical protein
LVDLVDDIGAGLLAERRDGSKATKKAGEQQGRLGLYPLNQVLVAFAAMLNLVCAI